MCCLFIFYFFIIRLPEILFSLLHKQLQWFIGTVPEYPGTVCLNGPAGDDACIFFNTGENRMRITRKVFHDLAIWMVGFGLSIGVTFPFFVMVFGVPSAIALKPGFFAACLGAGALAGIINYGLARQTVGARLKILAGNMHQVEQNLSRMTGSGNFSQCTTETCVITVDSEDEIGESALAFNRLVDALSTAMTTQAAVRSFSEMLTSQLEIDQLAEKALGQFFVHTGAAAGLIMYEFEGELKTAASRGLRNPDMVAASDHIRIAAKTGQRLSIAIPEGVRIESVAVDFRPAEVLIYPVIYKSVPLGVLVLATGSAFTLIHRERIDLFLQGLGLAMNNAIDHDRLQRLAALDPLTGIYNRRFGLGRLHEEFGRAVRNGSPLGVLMFDIDHFKDVNDTYGHLVGDRVLKSICAIARSSSLREGDVLLRYGGEEFVVVLPAASADDIRIVGERLRRSIEDSSLSDGAKTVKVTISVGGAAYPNHNVENEDVLLRLSDEAMYLAKNTGRNRVEIAR
jgi:diguanylate cyclase (GGDEF)-like protein